MDLRMVLLGFFGAASVSQVTGFGPIRLVHQTAAVPPAAASPLPPPTYRRHLDIERFRTDRKGSGAGSVLVQRAGLHLCSLLNSNRWARLQRQQQPLRYRPREARRDGGEELWAEDAEGTGGMWPSALARRGKLRGRAGVRLPAGGGGGEPGGEQCQLPKQQGAMLALPVLGRLLGNSANLFQVGVLLGTIPTLLAGVVCCYWAYQVIVAGSPDFQSRKLAESLKTLRLPPAKVGPGNPGFVDRPKLLDAEALRQEVQSRYNPTLLVHGERGSGKTVAVRLALHSSQSVVHVKLWGRDLARPLNALAQAIVDESGVQTTSASSAALVVEGAFNLIKGRGWRPGGALVPIVVVELDKRCSDAELLGVLLACKRWGDDENLAKFVVEAPSARIARGLPISLSDLRVEGVKVRPLAPTEAQQVALGCVPVAASRDWKGGRQDDLAKYIVSKVGLGMLDLVRVGFAARNARDPLALHAAVNRFATREARASRGGVTAFLVTLRSGLAKKGLAAGPGEEALERRLWGAIAGAAARAEGRSGKNPGLDEVLEKVGVSERVFEMAAKGVGPASPLSVDPFSYKVSVRSVFFKNALEAAAAAAAAAEAGELGEHSKGAHDKESA